MKKDSKSASYNPAFFSRSVETAINSAKEVIPLVLDYFTPRSVVDVGCGTGTWLSVWENKGVTDILGIDGPYISANELLISPEKFMSADLENKITLTKKYDLAMSLEVAEHISPATAQTFIESLCGMSNVVLFSAAIPGQGGTLHLNEQYPEYWMTHFSRFGFSPYDILREKIWENKNVNAYYRQNILFFVNDRAKDKFPLITKDSRPVLPIVHPDYLEEKQYEMDKYKYALRTPFHAGWFFIKKYGRIILSMFGYNRKK